ncbi:MAG TPA: S8 family serine peptidase, partial [Bdellovibrionales bacterium]|nr:S8 family serine peptidase [Bdellovibrionales bacterium]
MNVSEKPLFIAKKEFGVVEYLKKNPAHDGRGVIVGVLDDGIAPGQSGFKTTTDGKRKLLAVGSSSSMLRKKLAAAEATGDAFLQSAGPYARAWTGELTETPATSAWGIENGGDLNRDGKMESFKLAVLQKENQDSNDAGSELKICVDLDRNGTASSSECVRPFAATGEYTHWSAEKRLALTAEFDPASGELVLTEGEDLPDSHAEGVGSVLAGHNIGGLFDGVAPGAQIVSYDLAATSSNPYEVDYAAGDFLKGLEWLASRGAKIVNFSAYTYTADPKMQTFLRAALTELTKKYNFMIMVAAGNEGPGMHSDYERTAYPDAALLVGAFISRDLDALVHGVSGLPDPGRVMHYSSIGPGFDGGQTVDIISPLASLTHSSPSLGFRAFGGTSSASPAAAGVATIMASAIAAEGLPFEATTLAHALRLGAKPLPGVPYVIQGMGLPKVEAALAHYRRLIKGTGFLNAASKINDKTGADGSPLVGLTLLKSELTSQNEYSVTLQGTASPQIGPDGVKELLKPITLHYSHPWLSGVSELWLSEGPSKFNLRVDAAAAFAKHPELTEIFGEVAIREDNGTLLKVVPVTLIRDEPLHGRRAQMLALEPEDGHRIHFHVPAPGFVRVRVQTEGGNPATVRVNVYDSGFRAAAFNSGDKTRDYLFRATRRGWHQIGIARGGGSTAPMRAHVTLEPVDFSLADAELGSEFVVDYAGEEG